MKKPTLNSIFLQKIDVFTQKVLSVLTQKIIISTYLFFIY